jgi:hypothetical protein
MITGALGGKIQTYKQDHCNIHLITLNNITTNLYNRIDTTNRIVWDMNDQKEEEGQS